MDVRLIDGPLRNIIALFADLIIMPFSNRQYQDLVKLEFSNGDIRDKLTALDKSSLIEALNRKKRQVLFKYHPDRTKGNPELTQRFLEVTKAYERLMASEKFKTGIFDYLASDSFISAPINCLDLRMQEQIDERYEALISQFFLIDDDQEKREFVRQNEFFLQFVKWINDKRSSIEDIRVEAFYDITQESLLTIKVYQEWNKLVVQLFAEENLDDITYREAIALGELGHILALRKLLSPLKWLALLYCGLYNLISTTMEHYLGKVFKSLMEDVQSMRSNWLQVIPLLLKALALTVIIASGAIFLPASVYFTALSLPLLSRVLFYLANPINHMVRSIAKFLNISEGYAGLAMASLAILVAASLLMLSSLGSLIMVLTALTIAMNILSLITNVVFIKQLYELSPSLAVVIGLVLCLSLASDLLLNPLDSVSSPQTVYEVFLSFSVSLSSLGINVLACIFLSNHNNHYAELFTTLPLPEENAPQAVKQVINDNAPKKYWSKHLFNTAEPLDDKSIEKAQRSKQGLAFFDRSPEIRNESAQTPTLALEN